MSETRLDLLHLGDDIEAQKTQLLAHIGAEITALVGLHPVSDEDTIVADLTYVPGLEDIFWHELRTPTPIDSYTLYREWMARRPHFGTATCDGAAVWFNRQAYQAAQSYKFGGGDIQELTNPFLAMAHAKLFDMVAPAWGWCVVSTTSEDGSCRIKEIGALQNKLLVSDHIVAPPKHIIQQAIQDWSQLESIIHYDKPLLRVALDVAEESYDVLDCIVDPIRAAMAEGVSFKSALYDCIFDNPAMFIDNTPGLESEAETPRALQGVLTDIHAYRLALAA